MLEAHTLEEKQQAFDRLMQYTALDDQIRRRKAEDNREDWKTRVRLGAGVFLIPAGLSTAVFTDLKVYGIGLSAAGLACVSGRAYRAFMSVRKGQQDEQGNDDAEQEEDEDFD